MKPTDRLAAMAARRLTSWLTTCVDASGKEWIDAVRAEFDAIEGGWSQLSWAIGALPLAISFRRRRVLKRASSFRSLSPFTLNLLTLAVWWLALYGWMVLIPGGGPLHNNSTILAACLLGAVTARSIGSVGAARLLAGSGAWLTVELGFRFYRLEGVKGIPAHVAILSAALLSVALSALAEHHTSSGVRWQKGSTTNIADRARLAVIGVRQTLGFTAHALFGLTAFGVTSFAVRLATGWQPFETGTNYAIGTAAMLGAAFGGLISIDGDRLSSQSRRVSE